MAGSVLPPIVSSLPLQGGEFRAPSEVFNQIFEVFLILGTAVGIIVVAYTMYHALKYRDDGGDEDPYADKVERPSMGEMPTGGTGGRKVFYSFSISAVIVVSLIAWTYSQLLYIEQGPDPAQEAALEVEVEGFQFGWEFTYPNGHTTNTLTVPVDTVVRLEVTSSDVFHNFGIPELRAKADAMPGQTTTTWFAAEETGTYQAKCYEICGSGHSQMVTDVKVLPEEEYEAWYEDTEGTNQTESDGAGSEEGGNDSGGDDHRITAAAEQPTTGGTGSPPAIGGAGA